MSVKEKLNVNWKGIMRGLLFSENFIGKILESNEYFIIFRMEHAVPLSFEQAVAMGRSGGRMLGGTSPVLNGFKPKGGLHARHSDSDEEDWC